MSYKQYAKLQKYVNGSPTSEYKKGRLLASGLSVCEGTDIQTIKRWVEATGEYVCQGLDKYSKMKEQQSSDNITWTDTGNTRAGSLIQINSTDCGYIPPAPPYANEYFTLEALESGNMTSYHLFNTLFYSKNGGDWIYCTEDTVIPVVTGDKVRWKGSNHRGNTDYTPFSSTGNFIAYGNIMSLNNGDNFAGVTTLSQDNYGTFAHLFKNQTKLKDVSNLVLPILSFGDYSSIYQSMFEGCTSITTAPALPATAVSNYCYNSMFEGCTSLTTAPVISATTLGDWCCFEMFRDCTSLTTAPALPATTLGEYCYGQMFYGCTSLTTAPALPATVLGEKCYYNMFELCSSLVSAPSVLPATTLAKNCYEQMFLYCSSLTTAPQLPATTLVQECYRYMFFGCTRLQSVTCLAIDKSASNCTNNWLSGVSSTGTFTKAAGATWSTGASGIPSGWTIVNAT